MANSNDTILIAAIGAGGYDPCYYHFDGQQAQKTRLGFRALGELLDIPFEQLVVFGTESKPEQNLRGSNWDIIQQEFGRVLEDHQKVVVDFGMNTDEHYRMFAELARQVKGKDRIIIDVTHGFRSFPMILLMSLFYADSVDPDHTPEIRIFYGAFEAGVESDETFTNSFGTEKPVKKVSFVEMPVIPELLNWTKAAERFIKFGIASDLAELTENNKQLKPLPKRFDELHKHIAYNAIHDIPDHVDKLQKELKGKKKKLTATHPLYYLTNPVSDMLDQLSAELPSERQLKSARYFFDAGRYGQASIAYKEFLISLLTEAVLDETKQSEAKLKKNREWPETILGLLVQHTNPSDEQARENAEALKAQMEEWNPELPGRLRTTNEKLKEIRNTFAHGKQTNRLKYWTGELTEMLHQAEYYKQLRQAPVSEWIDRFRPFYENLDSNNNEM